MIGHNGGPGLGGGGFGLYAWRRARAELISERMPLEIVRRRVARAKELGLDYKSYASIRAASGRDVIAFLFSSNALRVGPRMVAIPAERAERLSALKGVTRLAAVHRPLAPETVARENAALIEAAHAAPTLAEGWSDTRARLAAMTAHHLHPDRQMPVEARRGDANGVLVIGETALEAEWMVAGRMAGYLPAARYFQTL